VTLLAFVSLFASSCAFEKQLVSDPAVMVGDLPSTWTGGGWQVPSQSVTGWAYDFKSPQLNALVNEAVDQSYSLSAALARLDQAAERATITNAGRLPEISATLQANRSQNLRGANFQKVRANNFNFATSVAWEIDLWGRIKNLRDADLDEVNAQANLYESSRLSLAANVAKVTFDIVEARLQIDLSNQTRRSLQTNLEILDARLEAGGGDERTALEISLTRADIAVVKAGIIENQRQLDAAKRILETLLGRYPSGMVESLWIMPTISREIPAGLPSELLLRRPDLLAAEARVDAALKDLAASRKALLPTVRINGGVGTSTTDEFGDILDIQNLIWNVGSNLARPLYRGGELKAQIRISEAQRNELVSDYANSALVAFREVETALASEGYIRGQIQELTLAAKEAQRAEALSLGQYEEGIVDIITLLDSQRRAFNSQSSLLSAQLLLLKNRVDLYLALGGDFDHLLTDK
tara:strand:- start:5896 stop:7299 length:1404 start_codon:yes stop_codon:yes gene_type:complete